MVGLDRPTSDTVTIGGKNYADLDAPLATVGALLDAKGVHPGRGARSHLRALAATHKMSDRRVKDVLIQTGLSEVARKRVGGFSLGMGQRLGLAAALLGDPEVLILYEPVNGLDPNGVLFVRQLLRHLASEGRTVLLSSHLMSEMAQTADHVIMRGRGRGRGRGRVVAAAPITELVGRGGEQITVRSPDAAKLAALLMAHHASPDMHIEWLSEDRFTARGIGAALVGRTAAQSEVELHELSSATSSLLDDPAGFLSEQLEQASPDLTRHMLQTFINALLSTDADAVCGAVYGQISDARVNSRNGYRHRDFDTRTGTLDVAIPKLRQGTYFPDWLFEGRHRARRP